MTLNNKTGHTMITPKMLRWILVLLAGFLILCAILLSCTSAKKMVEKAYAKDPNAVAEIARDKFPCTVLLKTDTTTMVRDSVVFIDCPEQPIQPGQIFHDTLINVVSGGVRTVRVPVHLPIEIKYVNRYFEDSAKIRLITADRDKWAGKVDRLEGSLAWYRKWFWWLLVLLIGSLGWNFRKLIFKTIA